GFYPDSHFDYLSANRDKILIAGALRPAPDESYCGGLWVLEVDSRDEAVRLIEQDPYFRLGLRKGYRLSPAGQGIFLFTPSGAGGHGREGKGRE
ncbi:MAG: YciI family protein, partial [Firmicutes bacterium]|nr:YciI family protein [Bacillota bacterium]